MPEGQSLRIWYTRQFTGDYPSSRSGHEGKGRGKSASATSLTPGARRDKLSQFRLHAARVSGRSAASSDSQSKAPAHCRGDTYLGGSVNIERAFGPVDGAMSKLSRARIFGVALLGVAVVGIPDYLIGFEISLSVFYLCPVSVATWYAGRKTGALIALISTFSALAADLNAGHFFSRPWILTWNGFLHLGFMLVVAYLLDSLRAHVEIEQELARSDPLTGIFNRRAFLEHLQHRLDLAAREGKPITLAYIDLDDFKRINDRSGHEEGDRVLRLVASTLTQSIRRTDVVARLGGDEFALVIAGADRSGAESIIAKTRHSLLRALDFEQSMLTCSIGCVTFQAPLPSADTAIRAADTLMYKVKNQGKNAVAFEVFDYQVSNVAQPSAASEGAPLISRVAS